MAMGALEIALAVMLLAAAGLTLKDILRLQQRDLGFTAHGVLRAPVETLASQFPTAQLRQQRIGEVIDRVRALPGVRSVGVVGPQLYPFGGERVTGAPFVIQSREGLEARAEVYVASPDYLRAVEIPLLGGRWISTQDQPASTPVVVVSHTVARRYWAEGGPLGQQVRLNPGAPDDPLRTIVGIVGDIRNPLGRDVQPTVYVPVAQSEATAVTLMVKTAGETRSLAPLLRALLQSMTPSAPARLADMESDIAEGYLSSQRFTTSVYGLLAVMALLIAALGVYGVISHWASSRTSEMGVRMALGAQAGDIVGTVLSRGSRLIGYGLALGAIGGFGLQRYIASELRDVRPNDPSVIAGVALLMALVASAAALRPAWRAARTSPAAAIKYE
jgi:predicted permease